MRPLRHETCVQSWASRASGLLRGRPSHIDDSSEAGLSRDQGLGRCRLANSPSTLALTFGQRLVVWRNDRNTNPILGTTGRGTFPCWRIGPL